MLVNVIFDIAKLLLFISYFISLSRPVSFRSFSNCGKTNRNNFYFYIKCNVCMGFVGFTNREKTVCACERIHAPNSTQNQINESHRRHQEKSHSKICSHIFFSIFRNKYSLLKNITLLSHLTEQRCFN